MAFHLLVRFVLCDFIIVFFNSVETTPNTYFLGLYVVLAVIVAINLACFYFLYAYGKEWVRYISYVVAASVAYNMAVAVETLLFNTVYAFLAQSFVFSTLNFALLAMVIMGKHIELGFDSSTQRSRNDRIFNHYRYSISAKSVD